MGSAPIRVGIAHSYHPAIAAAVGLVPLVLLVGWARVALHDHTPAQALAGAALGALVAASVFSLLR